MSGTLDGLSAALDDVFRGVREKFREASKEAGIWESLQGFAAAVDWTVLASFLRSELDFYVSFATLCCSSRTIL